MANVLQKPEIWAIITFRIGAAIPQGILRSLYVFLFWVPMKIISGIEIYPQTKIGEKLYIIHHGGIFIDPRTVIGNNCILLNNVNIGTRFDGKGAPVIGDNVRIGAGAKIIGAVNIGDDATIEANAVVTKDVPAGAIW
ncbi:MAG: serine acetyltransferase [Candidatus Omnitrophota bacterium]